MSVIVKGIFGKEMQMPQEGYVDIRLHFKGGRIECATMQTGNPPYYATFKVVELPPHGRLGDLDELKTAFPRCDNSMDIKIASVRATINHAPTIIEAEGSETDA